MQDSNIEPDRFQLCEKTYTKDMVVAAEATADQAQVAIHIVDYLWGSLPAELRIRTVLEVYDKLTERLALLDFPDDEGDERE